MHELTHSIIRTQHSYIDNISAKDNKDNDYSQKVEQLRHLLKWVNKNSQLRYLPQHQLGKKIDFGYFMIKIESINSLVFRKCHQQSKVYVILIAKLVNIKDNKKYPKITRIVKVLEEASTYTYDMKEPLIFYFYTTCQSEVLVKIEVLLSEQEIKNDSSLPIFGSPQNVGSIQIDFSKERKGKEKKYLILPNEFSLSSRDASETSIFSTSFANIYVNKSQAYKYLEKIIPENTLCDPSDRIAGVMGYFLPISQNALTDFSLSPQSHGLSLNFSNIEVNTVLLREANNRAELIAKSKHNSLSKVSSMMGEVVIRAKFHNGWKTVSECSSVLKQKGDIHLKTNQSNLSEFQNNPVNLKTQHGRKSLQNPMKIKANFKHYTCENALLLKLIFPQQQECVLIYQIQVDITVKGQIQNDQKKQLPDLFQEIITIPLCFGINSAKSIGNYRSLTCILNAGGCLRSFQPLKACIEQCFKQINLLKKSQAAKIPVESKSRIPSILMDVETVSNNNNKTLKTLENISNLSVKNKRNEIGFLDFQMQLKQLQDINLHVQQNLSIPFENFSSLNVSKIDIKDKIQHQKERISKESKKNLAIIKTNKLDIGFLKEIVISENQKQLLSKILPPKQNSYYAKETFLKLLKQQMSKHGYNQSKVHYQDEKKNISHKNHSKHISSEDTTQRTLYNFQLSKTSPENIIENKASKYFYYLFSNRIINQKYYFKYETIPIEIIKTELSEISYNNCYFINFVQVTNHINNSIVKFPKIFYFKMRFYNHQDIRSQLMTINKDTGQIVLVDSENSTNKVMHIQVNIDDQPSNYLLKFMQFIQFLHNGILNVEIIDYFTGLSFGLFTIPLRNMIRKRRNEVIYIHEDWIYHNNKIKANLKVELRAIRKMRHKNNVELISPNKPRESPIKQSKISQIKEAGEKDLRQERIQRYKQSKNKSIIQSNPDSEIKVESSKIAKMLSKAYTHQKIKIAVSYLKKQFFFIEVNNKHDTNITYRISISDQDKKWIDNNPLSGEQEITLVKDPSQLEKEDYQILTASKKYQQKMLKCFSLNEEEQLQLSARAKGYLLFCYLTVRRFKQNGVPKEEDITIFNRERTINCSLINEHNGNIDVIYAIEVIPTPEQSTIQLEYYRPSHQKSLIHFPFIDPQFIASKFDQILIDDPYVIIQPALNTSLPLIQRFTSATTGIYLQVSNDIPSQQYKEYNILILNDVKKKQQILGQSRKNQRSKIRTKAQSRIVPQFSEDSSGPKLIRFTLRVWGCMKLQISVPLWCEGQSFFKLRNDIFKERGIKNFFIVSDDEQVLKFWQDKKMKIQGLQLFKVSNGSVQTEISYSVTPCTPNDSYISIHAIDASDAVEQIQSIKLKQFKYVQPFFRLVMHLQTFIPNFKQMLKININRGSQGILQEPFTYRSNSNKKTQFRIYSSDAALVWVKSSDAVFQIDSKAERKLHIHFHTDKIIERGNLSGVCEGIVLGIKWEKGIDYYGFKFNIS